MCELAMVSRAGYYRDLQQQEPEEEEMEVRAAMQAIFLEHHRRYGRRRIVVELRNRGMVVNHKRVTRLMQTDNLVAVSRRKFVRTTDSQHRLEVAVNLAGTWS
jgi:transposase InsO family protein